MTVPLLLAAIGAAGCGSSSTTKTTIPSTSAGAGASSSAVVPSRSYTIKPEGSAEVPRTASTGGGTATISIRGAKQQVCWTFHVTGFTTPAAAHIHAGAAGVSGPIVVPLGGRYAPTGCVTAVSKAELSQIVASPKHFYVNVHTAKYPGGADRAEL